MKRTPCLGLAWPVVDSLLADARVQGTADQVRAMLVCARVRAIRNGVPYRFVWTARTFGCEPVVATGRRDDSLEDESTESAGKGEDRLRETLPEGVSLKWLPPSPSPDVNPDEDDQTEGPLPVVFQPDGTTSDATWRVTGSGGRSIRVELAGLTGRVTAERLIVAPKE